MITLNHRDGKPIYEQIKDGYRRQIFTGLLATDEKLPSVRELAAQLAINPNTIQRAYRELEAEGVIYSVVGKGSFVAGADQIKHDQKEKTKETFREVVTQLRHLGLSQAQVESLVAAAYQED